MIDPDDLTPEDLTLDGFLDGVVQAWQPRSGFRSASDAVLMASAVPALAGQTVLEMGCGAGVAALCLAHRTSAMVTGLELTPLYVGLAQRNGVDVVAGDVAALPGAIRARSFNHVMFNPPYYAAQAGPDAKTAHKAVAMREKLPLQIWLDAAVRRALSGGTVTAILGADRVPDILSACDSRLGRVRLRPLTSHAEKPAKRVIFQATKGARTPFELLPPLVLHGGDPGETDAHNPSDIAVNILRRGAEMPMTARSKAQMG